MSIYTVYFSPTGNTKKCVNAMAAAIGAHPNNCAFAEYDCTVEKIQAVREMVFQEQDFVIFGAPVYAGRIPEIFLSRLNCFRGNRTPCIIVASYGNRHFDDALLEMKDIAERNGFVVKGGAAVIGRHTYGEIQTDRPNQNDLDEMKEFALKAYNNTCDEVYIPGNPAYREGGKGGMFKPNTLETCVKCGICKSGCPANAIGDDFLVGEGCISCFRCIRNCPVKAKVMDTEKYIKFAADFTQKLAQRKENEFFL